VSSVRIQTGDKEPIEVLIVDAARQTLTGLTNIKLRIRRTSDDFFFDWSDNAFKAPASVVTMLQLLAEVDAANAPGRYHLNKAGHIRGFDTSTIFNPTTDDTYEATVLQDGTPQSAANVPQVGEIKVGDFLDFIDAAISDAATPADVAQALVDIRLHQLVNTNPGAVQPSTGTYIKQLLDEVKLRPTHLVLQGYGYDQINDRLEGLIWVEQGNLISSASTSCTVKWYDKDGTLLFTLVDAAPDSQGIFKVEKTTPGLAGDRVYYAIADVVVTGLGTVSGAKANITF
jgi:hypothetical protein